MTDTNIDLQAEQNEETGQDEEPHSDPVDSMIEEVPEEVSSELDFDSVKAKLAKFDSNSLEDLEYRDDTYSWILYTYCKYINMVLDRNPARQTIFFIISIAILVLSPLQFIALIWKGNPENLLLLLASAGEMLSAMIIFPKIIAEYLFNTNETTNINDVVKAIQNYDLTTQKDIRQMVEGTTNDKDT